MSRPAAKLQLPAPDVPSVSHDTDSAERWQSLFGCPAPHKSALIEQAIAWKQQVNLHGDLPASILRDLRIVAHQVSEARRHSNGGRASATIHKGASEIAPRRTSDSDICSAMQDLRAYIGPSTAPPATLLPASSQLAIGAQLVKHHNGETHVVEVVADGFAYRDQSYASLSAIAKVITGTHWNGLLFFGLRRRKTYARKPRA